MQTRIGELRMKEVVNIRSGNRFGFVGDLEVDLESGQIRALVLPGRLRMLGLFGREPERVIAWESVRRFGEDIILVDEEEMQIPYQQEKREKSLK